MCPLREVPIHSGGGADYQREKAVPLLIVEDVGAPDRLSRVL